MAVETKPETTRRVQGRRETTPAEGDTRPYFFWDRRITAADLREAIADRSHPEHVDLLAHLLREARPDEVWEYVSPEQVAAEWPRLAPRLGRRRAFWEWLIEGWVRLGFLDRRP
ncbi:hypothetical protein DCC79_02625 [bacterium]|nr:hypothetical protein [Chloroflexi bacterium CFX6]RIL12083.1 MAG: hypothetical protein DCC79_02625 [bacterium]